MPRVQGGAIRAFKVIAEQARGFQFSVNVDRPDGTHDDVVGQHVSAMTPSASSAGQPVMAVFLHLGTADASVRAHKGRTNSQADTDAQFLVAQMQAQVGAWKGVKPGARTGGDGSKKARPVCQARAEQQALRSGGPKSVVPGPLRPSFGGGGSGNRAQRQPPRRGFLQSRVRRR